MSEGEWKNEVKRRIDGRPCDWEHCALEICIERVTINDNKSSSNNKWKQTNATFNACQFHRLEGLETSKQTAKVAAQQFMQCKMYANISFIWNLLLCSARSDLIGHLAAAIVYSSGFSCIFSIMFASLILDICSSFMAEEKQTLSVPSKLPEMMAQLISNTLLQ